MKGLFLKLDGTNSSPAPGSRTSDLNERVTSVLARAMTDPELAESVRTILKLRFWERRSVEDICNQLDWPRASIYAALRAGVAHLVDALKTAGLTVDCLDEHA